MARPFAGKEGIFPPDGNTDEDIIYKKRKQKRKMKTTSLP